jgi:Cdc6-like AAA superfamily ATPase
MNEVTDALSPIEDGFRAENCFLFGPSGAGKTTGTRPAVRNDDRHPELRDVVRSNAKVWVW